MPTVSVALPGESGTSGLTIQLFNKTTGAVLNALSDTLTESAEEFFYNATVAETPVADTIYRVDVFDAAGDLLWTGWVMGAGATAIVATPDYPHSVGASSVEIDGFTTAGAAEMRSLLTAVRASIGIALVADEPLYITIGDDYSTDLGNQINWELENAADYPDMSDWTVKLFIKTGNTITELGDGTIETATGATRSGYVTALRASTSLLSQCDHARWHLKFYTAAGAEYVFESALVVGDAVIEPQIG